MRATLTVGPQLCTRYSMIKQSRMKNKKKNKSLRRPSLGGGRCAVHTHTGGGPPRCTSSIPNTSSNAANRDSLAFNISSGSAAPPTSIPPPPPPPPPPTTTTDRPPLSPSLSPSLLLTIPARPQGRLLTQQQVFAAQLKNLTPEGNTCFVFLLVVVVNDVKQTSEGAGLYLWWCE